MSTWGYGLYLRPGPWRCQRPRGGAKEVGCFFGTTDKAGADLQAAEAERKPLCSRSAVYSREPPIGDRTEGAATGSPVAVAHSIAVAPCSNLDGTPCPLHARVVSVVSPPPEGVGSPEPIPSDRVASLPRTPAKTAVENRVLPARVQPGFWPVSSFVDGCCARHHP